MNATKALSDGALTPLKMHQINNELIGYTSRIGVRVAGLFHAAREVIEEGRRHQTHGIRPLAYQVIDRAGVIVESGDVTVLFNDAYCVGGRNLGRGRVVLQAEGDCARRYPSCPRPRN